MEHYRTGAHTRYDLKYPFVWMTKYRKGILADEVGLRLRELIREICRTNEVEILQGSVGRDHVHVLLSCPPNLSPSKLMQYLKGKSSRKLLMKFRHLQKQNWGRHLWARRYFVASSGNVTHEKIQAYIREQEGTEPGDGGDDFHVTPSWLKDFSPSLTKLPLTYRLQPVGVQL